jgi:hypothetical protein
MGRREARTAGRAVTPEPFAARPAIAAPPGFCALQARFASPGRTARWGHAGLNALPPPTRTASRAAGPLRKSPACSSPATREDNWARVIRMTAAALGLGVGSVRNRMSWPFATKIFRPCRAAARRHVFNLRITGLPPDCASTPAMPTGAAPARIVPVSPATVLLLLPATPAPAPPTEPVMTTTACQPAKLFLTARPAPGSAPWRP